MKKSIKVIVAILIIIILLFLVVKIQKKDEKSDEFKIVTSFYPMYIIALNVADGANNISIENMADVSVGCLHEYSLVTKDLVKLENADVFIQNGLGVELFMDKVISNYPELNIIDSSKNVKNIIVEHEENHEESHEEGDDCHEHEENGHVWLNIENYISQVQTICDELCTYNPENVDIYRENTKEYIRKLENLKQEYDNFEKKDVTVISFNESFAYLLDYLQIETLEIESGHEESVMSAKKLGEIIDKAKEDEIKAILLDKNDNIRDAKIIENETNCNIYNLNSCLYGNEEKDSYINQMKENLQIIKNLL